MEIQKSVPQNELIIDLVRKTEASDCPRELWKEAVILARNEGNKIIVNDSNPYLDVEEIILFGEKIQKVNSDEEKQKILMEKTKSGKLWYDVISGDSNKIMFDPVEKDIKKIFQLTNNKWTKVADIGTGTGNTLRSIAPYCEKIYGVDSSSLALETAKEIGIPENASLIISKANKLPFSNHSLDLIVSNGLIYYLSLKETESFVNELSRVLKHGGIFYYSNFFKEENEIVPKIFNKSLESAKSALLNLLGGIVNEGGHPESLGLLDYHKLIIKSNFSLTNKVIGNDNSVLFEYTRN